MMKFVIAMVIVALAMGFQQSRFATKSMMKMTIESPISTNKLIGAALIASTLLSGLPSIAKEGAGPKQSFFGIGGSKSFSEALDSNEDREDPKFSPYSPFGNGEKAVYNARKNTPEEIKFWKGKFDESL